MHASSTERGRRDLSDEIPVALSPTARSSAHASTHSVREDTAQQEPAPEPTRRPSLFHAATLNMGFLPRLRKRSTVGRNYWEPSRRSKAALQWDLAKSIPLKDLYPLLIPVQRAFFEKLDIELDKVESFYVEREKEMRARCVTFYLALLTFRLIIQQNLGIESADAGTQTTQTSVLCKRICT